MRSVLRLAICGAMSGACVGCSNLKQPSIAVVGATMGESTAQAATLNLALQLGNPNPEPLELLEFKYHVEVDGRRVYEGTRAAQMTLMRESTRAVEIPAVIPLESVGWSAAAIPSTAQVRVSGTLRYIQPGAIAQTLFDTGVRRPRASFSGNSTVAIVIPATAPASSPATAP
jgi:LEA14-like dessication related protein